MLGRNAQGKGEVVRGGWADVARRLPGTLRVRTRANCFGDKVLVFPIVSDSLPSLPNRAINILLLPFPISFVRKITRSKRVARLVLRDAVGQSVDGIGEIHARLVAGVDWLRSEVLDALEIRTAQARAPQRDGRRQAWIAPTSYRLSTSARNATAFE